MTTSLIPLHKGFSERTAKSGTPNLVRKFETLSTGESGKADVYSIEAFFSTGPVRPGYKEVQSLVAEAEAIPERKQALEQARKRLAEMRANSGGVTLDQLRLRAGYSQTKLAEMIGTTQARLSMYESGKCDMMFESAASLAKTLSISLDELYRAISNSKSRA